MADLAAQVCGVGHQCERHHREHQHDRQGPARRLARDPAPLPQRQPGEEAGGLHQRECQQRRVLVRSNRGRRDARAVLDQLLRPDAGHVGGDRHVGDDKEDRQAGPLQAIVPPREANQKDDQPDAKPDRRHVIQHDVQVCGIGKELPHHPAPVPDYSRPLTGPTYASRRPAVIAPSQQISDATASILALAGNSPIRCRLRPEDPLLHHPLHDDAERDEQHLDRENPDSSVSWWRRPAGESSR